MIDLLLDSSIVIDAANQQARAVAYIRESLVARFPAIHTITFAEVIVGTRNGRELFKLQRFLRPFTLEYPTIEDWPIAIDHLSRLHLSHNVDLPDCLIAATALRLAIPVATVNDRHFRLFKGLKVIRPY
jgi:predicted nucleic acid-binding protein